MHLPLPEIPGYSVSSIIGYGGTATVYLATQQKLQRKVALKVLNPSATDTPDYCERFLREAQATAIVCDHPHIVTVHEFAQYNNVYYIAMQYLPGKNLRQRIDSGKPFEHPVKIIQQIAIALGYVHEKGYIHRDIKPANVLFNESGEAILSDFGVVKTHSQNTQLTHHGSVIGTAKYMSPEQCRGNPDIDLRSDLYSLGVVFFEMLTSYPPYESTDPMALMLKHVSDPVPRLPAQLAMYQSILNKLLAKQPDQRYHSADQLLEALSRFSNQSLKKSRTDKSINALGAISRNIALPQTSSKRIIGTAATVLVLLAASLAIMKTIPNSSMPDQLLRCPSLTSEEIKSRDALIDLAEAHKAVDRLDHPLGANALEAYLLALGVDPCNAATRKQIENIRRKVSQSQ